MANIKGCLSSKNVEWRTPKNFYEKLNEEFNFTLDPCATAENHKCNKYYTIKENGLLQNWGGETVFCNPPYGRKDTAEWIKKCYLESQKENTTVVLLIPARTDTKAFHEYIYHKAEIRFVKGRLKFNDSKEAAPFPSMVVVFKGVKNEQK